MAVTLSHLVDPDPNSIGHDVNEFLEFLGGPSSILLTGEDTSRCRAFVTLLHGNEPSGTRALFDWIKSGLKPAVNVICIVASVEAARELPTFSHRVIEPKRDLNRCFKSPFDDEQGELAEIILKTLKEYQPEATIDMHNTSGSGPAFAVATHADQEHDALTSLFCRRMIITHLRLGALMEISEYLCPTVTIECGGRLDEEAHAIGREGVKRYFSAQEVLSQGKSDFDLEILHNPVRLELAKQCEIVYSKSSSDEAHLVLNPDIERLNSGITPTGTSLGWVNTEKLSDILTSIDSNNSCVLSEIVEIKDQQLVTSQALKLFMVTNNPVIAKMDCLFYAVKSDGFEILAD